MLIWISVQRSVSIIEERVRSVLVENVEGTVEKKDRAKRVVDASRELQGRFLQEQLTESSGRRLLVIPRRTLQQRDH